MLQSRHAVQTFKSFWDSFQNRLCMQCHYLQNRFRKTLDDRPPPITDVKPSNILLDLHGNIKLCDFGISGYLVNSVAQTREAGCRPYMAVSFLLNIRNSCCEKIWRNILTFGTLITMHILYYYYYHTIYHYLLFAVFD